MVRTAQRYRMRTFSELTELSPEVLRAWERRHGLLLPDRPEGGHRLYTDDDLRVIQRVRALLAEGRAIGEIAARGRKALLAEDGAIGVDQVRRTHVGSSGIVEAIVNAAELLDHAALSHAVDRAFSSLSPEAVIEEVIEPSTEEIGRRWSLGELSIAGEHLASAVFRGRIERLFQTVNSARSDARLVVCACLPGEEHELGILALALRLANAGFRVGYLGGHLPLGEVEACVRKLGADAVCLSAKRTEVVAQCSEELLLLADALLPRVQIHLGGISDGEPAKKICRRMRCWGHRSRLDLLFKVLRTRPR